MNKNISDPAISHFLDEVTDQISYQPLRTSIRQELESHIQDNIEDFKSQGLSSADAVCQALRSMGDAVSIGTELNEAHKIQKSPLACIYFCIAPPFRFYSLQFYAMDPRAGGKQLSLLHSRRNSAYLYSIERISFFDPLQKNTGNFCMLPVFGSNRYILPDAL